MTSYRCTRGSRPRFTLIELLVVVAIIAILAAMLMPALAKARAVARAATCGQNARQQAMAMILYAGDHEDWLPFAYGIDTDTAVYGGSAGTPATGYGGRNWSLFILPYVSSDTRVFHCPGWWPTAEEESLAGQAPWYYMLNGAEALVYTTYRANPYLGHDGGTGSYSGGCRSQNYDYLDMPLYARLDNAADTVLSYCASRIQYPYSPSPQCASTLFDNGAGSGDRSDPANYSDYKRRINMGLVHGGVSRVSVLRSNTPGVSAYPNGKANVSFFDGHVELLGGDSGKTFYDTTDRYWRINK